MTDKPRVRELLEEILNSERAPEQVCVDCPELLPEVRERWQQMRLVKAELEALFPGPPTPDANTTGACSQATDLPRIPGYEVEAELGRGGMGIVYRARHLRLNRPVALKMLLAGAHAGRLERERFLREAEAVAGLRHANIVQVHDVGEEEGRSYFTMEYVEGGSLAQKLAGKPLPARQAVALLATLAGAVHAAHRGGIVHRDLKPANVLLTADGTPKISDFGLARRLEGEAGLTRTGTVVGTPSYMAPEQAAGKALPVGPATDVYALGAILYELLTGRPPFQAETAVETLQQVICQDPVAPSRLNAKVPRDLDTICLKCLEKDPNKRYVTAGELATDLERYLRHEPILARPVSLVERCWRWMRRHVGLAAALSGIALLLVVLVIGSLWSAAHFQKMEREQRGLALERGELADEKENERAKAVRAEMQEAGLRIQAEKQSRELRQNLYFARMNLAGQAALFPSGIGPVSQWLAPWEKDEPDLRDWEWYYLEGLCHRDLLTLRGQVNGARAVAWSKDGRLASVAADGVVRIWDAVEGQEIRRFGGHGGDAVSLAWSPDGKKLASGLRDGTLKIWDLVAGQELLTLRGHTGQVFSVAWSPDGKRLASGGADQTVRVWDAARGIAIHILRGHTNSVIAVAWSANGKRLASAGQNSLIRLWDADTGKEGPALRGHKNWVNSVAWSPDGSRLASASNDQTIKVWDPANGREMQTLRGHVQGVLSVAWSPDGLRLASCSEDQTVKIWPLASGAEARTLRGHTAPVTSVAWSPDGTRLASASYDATIKVWDAHAEPETPVLPGHGDSIYSLAWRPDGQRLASASADGTIKIWDMAHPREQTTLRGHEGWVCSAAWSPDGTQLASAGSDQLIRVWDTVSGEELKSLRGHTGQVLSVAWCPQGRRLASAGIDLTVRIWDAKTGGELQICRGHQRRVYCVAWSPDGTQLASASADGTIRVWEAATGRETNVLRIHTGQVATVAWSPDGKRLASASYDQTVKVSDPATGKVDLTLYGHTARVNAVAWNPEGTRLASAGEDRTVKIWDAATGKETLTLSGHASAVNAVAWSPDGLLLVSAGNDRTILVHDASAGYLAVRSPRDLPTLDRRLANDPNDRTDWRLRAEIHARLQDWEKAAADIRHCLALNRDMRWCAAACWVVGPYPEDMNASYPLEKNADPGQGVAAAGETDPSGRPLVWQSVPTDTQGFVDFGSLFGKAEHISAYALLRVYSAKQQQVAILCGSDDYVRLWLNGKQIHECLLERRAVPDEDAVPATLEPGWNTLLARVANVTGEHALYWRLSDAPAAMARARGDPGR